MRLESYHRAAPGAFASKFGYDGGMVAALALSLLLAAAVEPLPKEFEYRLSLARALPAPYSAAVIVALIPSAKLSPAQTAILAEEAYNLAGKDQAIAVKAWALHRDNYDRKTGFALAFPARPRSLPTVCAESEIDDPKSYYRNALEIGDFARSLQNIRSAVEIGRAIEAVAATPVSQQRQILGLFIRALPLATGSDREFVYAVRYTGLHTSLLKMAGAGGANILLNYRLFLMANWRGRRCAGNRADEFKGVIDEFNKAVRGTAIPQIDEEDANVISVDTITKVTPANSFPLSYKVAHAPINETSVTSMLHELEQFQPEEKPDALAIQRAKDSIYRKFSERLKNSIWHDRVIRDWVHFIVYSQMKTDDAPLWFAAARTFADWAKDSSARQSELITAGDPGLSAYVRLVTLLPESEVTRVLP